MAIGGWVLVATEHLQRIIVEHCHDKHGAGHMGMNKTTGRVNAIQCWIVAWCMHGAVQCATVKRNLKRSQMLIRCDIMQDLQRIHIDNLGPCLRHPEEISMCWWINYLSG